MMDPELKAKWLAELRSGNRKQTHGYLRWGDKFSCLGVLADVGGCTWSGNQALTPDGLGIGVLLSVDDGSSPYGPSYGLRYRQRTELALMNDHNKTFAEIADFIESPAFEALGE